MKLVLLTAPGEVVRFKKELVGMGYEVIEYPVSNDISVITDSRKKELYDRVQKVSSFMPLSPKELSRKAAFIKMLLDPAFEHDEYIIFGEHNVHTIFNAETNKNIIKDSIKKYKDSDVFRLFCDNSKYYRLDTGVKYSFLNYLNALNNDKSVATDGHYAYVIPCRSRKKIANALMANGLNIENTLEIATRLQEINAYVSNENVFKEVQDITVQHANTLPGWRKRKFAVCMTTYKRPDAACKQIFAMLNQDYAADLYHLFVAVKGVPELYFNTYMLTLFKQFIDSGRLTLRYYPNYNQLTNFLDTIRDCDMSSYDKICVIADDALYAPNYLTCVNEFLATVHEQSSAYYAGPIIQHFHADGYLNYLTVKSSTPFSLFVLDRIVLSDLYKGEHDSEFIESVIHSKAANKYKEYTFILQCCKKYGLANMYPYFFAKTGAKNAVPWLCVPKKHDLITTLNNAFSYNEKEENKPTKEYVFIVVDNDNKSLTGSVRLYKEQNIIIFINNNIKAKVLEFSNKKLVVDFSFDGGQVKIYGSKDGGVTYSLPN